MKDDRLYPIDRLSSGHGKARCPICGRSSYCMSTVDMETVLCRRIVEKHIPNHGYTAQETKSSIIGTLFKLNGTKTKQTIISSFSTPVRKPESDFTEYAKMAYRATDRIAFASRLGVSVESCNEIKVGHTMYYLNNSLQPAYTIPMRNENMKIIGIRLRFESGPKRSVKGSMGGFISRPAISHSRDTLYICEGESDLLSAISMGMNNIIAKPGRFVGDKYIIEFLKIGIDKVGGRRPVVLISDNDKDGYDGAIRSSKLYQGICSSVKVIIPPAKDLREWYNSGKASIEKIEYLVNNTKPIQIARNLSS